MPIGQKRGYSPYGEGGRTERDECLQMEETAHSLVLIEREERSEWSGPTVTELSCPIRFTRLPYLFAISIIIIFRVGTVTPLT